MNTNKKSQCDYCAFLHLEDQSNILSERAVEEKHSTLRSLIGAPKKTRKISIGGDDAKTETCFINSPNWTPNKNNQKHCNDFIENNILLPDALKSRETNILISKIENLQTEKKTENITNKIHNPRFMLFDKNKKGIDLIRIAEGVMIGVLVLFVGWIIYYYFHINLKP